MSCFGVSSGENTLPLAKVTHQFNLGDQVHSWVAPLGMKSPRMSFGFWRGQFLPFPSVRVHLGTSWFDLNFPTVWNCWGTLFPPSQGLGPPAAGRVSLARGVPVAGGTSVAVGSYSSSPFVLSGLQLSQGPIGGHPLWGPSSPHTSCSLWQWTSHMSHSLWQQMLYKDQTREHHPATVSITSRVVQKAA